MKLDFGKVLLGLGGVALLYGLFKTAAVPKAEATPPPATNGLAGVKRGKKKSKKHGRKAKRKGLGTVITSSYVKPMAANALRPKR